MNELILTPDNFKEGLEVAPSIQGITESPDYYRDYTTGILTGINEHGHAMVRWKEKPGIEANLYMRDLKIIFKENPFQDFYKVVEELNKL